MLIVGLIILGLTVGIRIVADCGRNSCQVASKIKQDTAPYFTGITAIIFIHCYVLCIIYYPCIIPFSDLAFIFLLRLIRIIINTNQ